MSLSHQKCSSNNKVITDSNNTNKTVIKVEQEERQCGTYDVIVTDYIIPRRNKFKFNKVAISREEQGQVSYIEEKDQSTDMEGTDQQTLETQDHSSCLKESNQSATLEDQDQCSLIVAQELSTTVEAQEQHTSVETHGQCTLMEVQEQSTSVQAQGQCTITQDECTNGEEPGMCTVMNNQHQCGNEKTDVDMEIMPEQEATVVVDTPHSSKSRGTAKLLPHVEAISEKSNECKVCGKSFTRSAYLKQHLLMHTGEKTYKCKVCEKSFTQSEHLKDHERIHTGEKPYKCKVCGKSFTHSATWKNHESLHTGEKPTHARCVKSPLLKVLI